jgi:hypothetical protein
MCSYIMIKSMSFDELVLGFKPCPTGLLISGQLFNLSVIGFLTYKIGNREN